uniref:Interleukin-6 receptor subunit beta-like n=1 Tax=Mastacembelus armatus TaxID=205130 RepID=A0A7N8Y6N9_9TELE
KGCWSYIKTWFKLPNRTKVTVNPTDLKPCEDDDKVCVTDVRDCGPRPSASIQKTLNMSCYYQISHRSMTCEWSQDSNSHIESHVSLIFSSRGKVFCRGIFNPSAFLTITAKVKNYLTGNWEWSQPHDVFLNDAVKPPQPELTVSGSTDDSVTVSWKSHSDGSCRLRYRVDGTHTWSQAPESVPACLNQMLVYTIKDLLPFIVYRAAVACREESGTWSNWSTDVTMRTQDRVPSGPPEVCYRLERRDSGGPVLLHLLWKPDPHDAGGRILGYQVSYRPQRKQQLQDMSVQNVTEETAPLMVEEGNWSVTVAAFNTAGYGPRALLSIDTHSQTSLPPVRDLWVSSSSKGLRVQWQRPPPSTPPVTHFTVRWSSETSPSTHRWATVDGFLNSTVIPDVDPEESYQVSVFPVSMQQCGPPQSVPASLQQGALMEADSLKVVGRTKTTVAVEWVWQRKSGPIRVDGYSVELRRDSDRWTVPVWPDQWQHTFINLNPSTEYSLHLLADNVSRSSISSVTTCFGEF